MHHIAIPLITLGVYVLRRVVKQLPAKYLPWLAALTGMICALVSGDANVKGIVEGVAEGLAAAGLWSAAGKHILPGGTATPVQPAITEPK